MAADTGPSRREQGNALFRQGKFAEACKEYTAAIEQDPEDSSAYSNRSAARLKLGQAAAAADDARAALDLRPDWSKAHFRLGCALEAQEQLDTALEAFRCGLDLDPESKELSDRASQLRRRIAQAGGSTARPRQQPSPAAAGMFGGAAAGAPAPAPGGPADLPGPDAWAAGLPEEKQYEWLVDCYRMRVDDSYALGGGDIKLGCLYDPDCTRESIAGDFLVFCKLAVAHGVVPSAGWSWPKFLRTAAGLLGYAFEKSDAQEKYGRENVFAVFWGGRSLRHTGEVVMGSSCVYGSEESEEAGELYDQILDKMDYWLGPSSGVQCERLFADVGGRDAWRHLVASMHLERGY